MDTAYDLGSLVRGSLDRRENWGICNTIRGAATRIASEMTVAKNKNKIKKACEQTNRNTREGVDLLTTKEIGTTGGTRQIAPGISFHPASVNSHTQNSCAINMANSRTKNTAVPGGKELATWKGNMGWILIHSRILLCVCQGVILTTVNIIETLAPLLDDEPTIPSRVHNVRRTSPKWRVKANSEDVCTSGPHPR